MAAQHDHIEHKHGAMDIRDHERTFEGFVHAVTWVVGIVIVVLVFLALANA